MLVITKALREYMEKHHNLPAGASDDTVQAAVQSAMFAADNPLTFEKVKELTDTKSVVNDTVKGIVTETVQQMALKGTHTPGQVFGQAGIEREPHIIVRSPSEQYGDHRYERKHMKTGQPVYDERGNTAFYPSRKDVAMASVYLKVQARNAGYDVVLDDRERALWNEHLTDAVKWCGKLEGVHQTDIPGGRIKAILTDNVSGGQEAVPEYFDQMSVANQLVYGEVFPFVDLQPVPRGSQVEAVKVGIPEVTSGTPSGTAVALFDTDDIITAIDNSIYPVSIAVEMGLDWLADHSGNAAAKFMENINMKFAEWLDRMVAIGNGTSEPEGIFNASGTSSAPAANGNGGPPTLADYEDLLFGINKQYRKAMNRPSFISNDVSYKRLRGIAVDASNDQRRILGHDYQSYNPLEFPHRIVTEVSNTQVAFGALALYRMYRREGNSVQFARGDWGLMLANKEGVLVRGRWGGSVMVAEAFVICSNAQS